MAHILGIVGSPSHPSRTYGLVEYAAKILSQQGFTVDIISARDIPAEDLVFGRYDSPALEKPKALLEKADGVIIATPIYKAAYTGVLKAFLDLLPQKARFRKSHTSTCQRWDDRSFIVYRICFETCAVRIRS